MKVRYFVDSWAWIEYFKPKRSDEKLREVIEGSNELITLTTVLAEVYYKFLADVGEEAAERAAEFIKRKSVVISLDEELAKAAARIKKEERLALADAFAYAGAKKFDATLATGDPDFKSLAKVLYLGK